jgi:uncharacterized membrane protein
VLAILGGLGAALCWATTTLVASRASRLIDSWSLLASVMTVGLLVAAPAAAISGAPENLDDRAVGWLVVSGAGNVVGLLCAYSALRIGKVGLVGPISSTEGAIAALISVVAGERLAPGAGITLAVITVGVVLATRFASFALGARHGLAVSAVLASQFAAIAAVVAYLAFHERLRRVQVIGVTTIVVGVSVLSALNG